MVSLASNFSARSNIDPEFYYALFRVKVPADVAVLNLMAPDMVKEVWQRTIERQVISTKLKEQIPDALANFKACSTNRLLEEAAQIGTPSSSVLIRNVLIEYIVDDLNEQKRFVKLLQNQDDLGRWWKGVRREFPVVASRLKLDINMAFLTINNPPLVRELYQYFDGLQDAYLRQPLDLILQGFYQQTPWRGLIEGDVSIPDVILGDTTDEK
jgi:hypothetical protein